MTTKLKLFYASFIFFIAASALTAGCSSSGTPSVSTSVSAETPIDISETITYLPQASGIFIHESESVTIDYSHSEDGYIMVKYLGNHSGKIKFQITGPSELTYTFDLHVDADYITLPLTSGSGTYILNTFEQDSGTDYYTVDSTTISVELTDDLTTYLYPNYFVDYNPESLVIELSVLAATDVYSEIDLISSVYYTVMETLTYSTEKALIASESSLTSFIPDLDEVIETGEGICFDYASLMVAMLRIQNMPSQLVIGYAGEVSHAWINVYTKENGWIDKVITFDGEQWTLMDPTFADNTDNKGALNSFIGDGTNYTSKYIY